jgi:hypothetical protein
MWIAIVLKMWMDIAKTWMDIFLKNVYRYCFKNLDVYCLKMWMDVVKM